LHPCRQALGVLGPWAADHLFDLFHPLLKYSARVMANLENLLGKNPLPIINENNFQEVCRETERKHWESGESAQDCARSIYPLLMPFALD
jgi:hypothetical protein